MGKIKVMPGDNMKTFLRNLAILIGIIVILTILFSGPMGQITQVYNGLGILPIVIIVILVAALPRKSRH
jgi:hypothetical protein